ncbi:MAG: hypothetical protein HZC52_03910 [Planctomycetes bacterium]|nr:hypothetical protein [Planctomycetota bacterium]
MTDTLTRVNVKASKLRRVKRMRKKLTLTIDGDVYDMLTEVPRNISLSEVATFFFKAFIADVKRGRELSQKEFDEWVESDAGLKEVREYLRGHLGPPIWKIEDTVNDIKKKVRRKKGK